MGSPFRVRCRRLLIWTLVRDGDRYSSMEQSRSFTHSEVPGKSYQALEVHTWQVSTVLWARGWVTSLVDVADSLGPSHGVKQLS